MKISILIFFLLSTTFCFAQNVAINTDGSSPDPSAILDINSITKGVLIPRLKTSQRLAITSAALGLVVYDLVTQSFWYKGETVWYEISKTTAEFWKKFGSSLVYNKDSLPVIISNAGYNVLNEAILNTHKKDASTTGLVDVLSIQRSSSGTATDNIGGSIVFRNQADDNSLALSGRIFTSLTEAAVATNKSSMGFTTYNDGTAAMNMNMTAGGLKVGSLTAATSMLDVAGDADVSGKIKVTGEVNRPSTTDANLVPIAYGYVNSFGVMVSANSTSNVSSTAVSGNGNSGKYDVRITGTSVDLDDIVVIVTNRTAEPLFFSVSNPINSSYTFSVNVWDKDGIRATSKFFHFVVYRK